MGCNCNEHVNPLMPEIVVIEDIRIDTEDVTTFRVIKPNGGKPFDHMPGQCAMISVPPLGEAIFSITSSPTQKDFMEFSVKRCGVVTEYLHGLEVGSEIGIRGPYGNNFPVEDELKGKDLAFHRWGYRPCTHSVSYKLCNG